MCREAGLDNAFHDTKVFAGVLELRNNDLRMTDGIGFVLVDRRVQGNNVNVVNFLGASDVMFQLDCIGPPSLERLFDAHERCTLLIKGHR